MKESGAFDIVGVLAPVRRRIGLSRLLQDALLGLGAGAFAGAVVLAGVHFLSISLTPLFALVLAVCGLFAGIAHAIQHWPSDFEAARTADSQLDLHDRVTTALEFRASGDSFAALQRSDLARRLDTLQLAQAGRRRPSLREFGAAFAGVAAIVLALLVASPAHSGSAAPATSADQQHIHRVAGTQVPRITRKLEQGLTAKQRQDASIRKLENALARLRRQLAQAATRPAALRAISATQQQLHRLAASLHPINSHAVARLNGSLMRYLNAQERAAASSGGTKALAAAARALRRLASSLGRLSAAQRSQLARALAKSANSSTDSQLRAGLQQAASSLAYGDPHSAVSALQQAAQALQRTPAAQSAQQRLGQAGSQLDQLKQEVSGVSATSAGSGSSGTPGAGSQSPSGASTGKGSGPGTGSGKGGTGKAQGQGAGQGSGQGQGANSGQGSGRGAGQPVSGAGPGSGRGAGNGQGQGGTGGHGAGGGRGGIGPHGQGRYATVYAPGKQGTGPHTIQTGPNGASLQGPIVPYQQVVQQYANAAHAALDQSNLPPNLRTVVRDYFSRVSR